jgi:DUF4097 and DUF4098 domain-containing protein YvlB
MILTSIAFTVAASAAAETQVDERRPAKPDGMIQIAIPAGAFRVVGWEKAEIAVKGTLGDDAQGIDIGDGGEHTRIKIKGAPHTQADLEINVPSGSRLNIETFSGHVNVGRVTGRVVVESVSGNVSIDGALDVSVDSVSGAVDISETRKVDVEAVNGPVTIRKGGGEVRASTVDGALEVDGEGFEYAKLGTISGALKFDGGLTKTANLAAKTVSGVVTLVLPASVDADFDVRTFSGTVENELGPKAEQKHAVLPSKNLHFTSGSGSAKVSVATMSGPVHLKAK